MDWVAKRNFDQSATFTHQQITSLEMIGLPLKVGGAAISGLPRDGGDAAVEHGPGNAVWLLQDVGSLPPWSCPFDHRQNASECSISRGTCNEAQACGC